MILITKSAKADLDCLDGVIRKRIAKKLLYLRKDPKNLSKRLVDFKQGEYRYRVGDYRVCFDIEDNKIIILRIGHRKKVYEG